MRFKSETYIELNIKRVASIENGIYIEWDI